ncbi:hypothetical protein HanIR_Chr04g0153361 [Helianthus annuus]|nr:hypothetical protein HanIR_Chr04g0153361 [Helianthus annuus]
MGDRPSERRRGICFKGSVSNTCLNQKRQPYFACLAAEFRTRRCGCSSSKDIDLDQDWYN